MIDPELTGVLELLPQIDLTDPVAARAWRPSLAWSYSASCR